MNRYVAACCFCLVFETPATFADDPGRLDRIRDTADTVGEMYRAYATDNHLPGLAWGVIAGGELVYAGATGFSDLDRKTPATPATMFRIASMSKSFTALAILQLRDAGKLRLDEPAATYLPELADVDYLTSDAPAITVRHLLMHAGGFPEDNPWGDRQLADSDDELMAVIEGGVSMSTVPGIQYEYSNLGFALLGQIVQRVSGMPFDRYMSKNVFEPLGMNSTVYEFADAPAGRLALGYGYRDGEWFDEPLLHHGSYGAMGGLITSVLDFSRYAALHLAAWPPGSSDDDGPLGRSSLREMHHPWNYAGMIAEFAYPDGRRCPMALAYAYGLAWRSDCDGRVYIRHSGGLPGFGSDWTMLPHYDLAVVSFDNRTYAGTSGVNVSVLDTIVRTAGLKPRDYPASAVLERRRNELLGVLPGFEGAAMSQLFAENFFLDTPLSSWRDTARAAFTRAGAVSGSGPLVAMNELRGEFMLHGEMRDLRIFFTLTPEPEPRIQELRISVLDK